MIIDFYKYTTYFNSFLRWYINNYEHLNINILNNIEKFIILHKKLTPESNHNVFGFLLKIINILDIDLAIINEWKDYSLIYTDYTTELRLRRNK